MVHRLVHTFSFVIVELLKPFIDRSDSDFASRSQRLNSINVHVLHTSKEKQNTKQLDIIQYR